MNKISAYWNTFKLEMSRSLTVFNKDFFTFLYSPVAYIVTSVFLIISGWFFFSRFFIFDQLELRIFFDDLPFIFVFIIPAITMRLYSEEFNIGSYELLLTMPLKIENVIIGKFLAAMGFIAIMILPTLSYVIFLYFLGDLDLGPVIGGYIGIFFLGGAFSAIGIFASSLTKNQIIAFIIATALCFVLFLVDKILIFFPTAILEPLQYLSADYHFKNISKGVIDSRDLLYFISMMAVFLFSTKYVLERRK